MAKILGLGGIFLQFKGEEKAVQKWYHTFLGLDMSEYGTGFIEGEQLVLLTFSRMRENSPYVNFRVDNIEELFQKLKENNLEIIDEISEYEYGKFGQFKDPFGNVIELWEAYTENYKSMVKQEIKNYKKSNLD